MAWTCPTCGHDNALTTRNCENCGQFNEAAFRPARGGSGVSTESSSAVQSLTKHVTSVVVTDIRMPFGSMVTFMVKWAIASVPAMVILVIIVFVMLTILATVFGGILGAMLR
jgi:uncharacterized membrane protein YvbJ